MRLTILGSGSPEPHIRRASSGYLVETEKSRILFDCGGGVFDRLLQAGHNPGDVDTLIFSHLHSDHMMDYARLVHAAWDAGGVPLRVTGPTPIGRITHQLFGPDGVFSDDLRARTELAPSQAVWLARGGTLPRPWPAPRVTEIAPGDTIDGPDWQVQSIVAPHAQPALTCMAFRLTSGDRSFVYSGDTALTPELEALSADADLLLHWCYRLSTDEVPPELASMTPTPKEIGAMAARASVRRVFLTHFRAHMDTDAGHASARDDLAATFPGPAGIVEDLDRYDI